MGAELEPSARQEDADAMSMERELEKKASKKKRRMSQTQLEELASNEEGLIPSGLNRAVRPGSIRAGAAFLFWRSYARPVPSRVRAYVGIGANVGDPSPTLRNAVRALARCPGVRCAACLGCTRRSPLASLTSPTSLNAAVALDVPAGPDPETGALALLAALKSLEQSIGRVARQRWGPREVDLDLLVFGRHQINVQRPDERWLVVPHPHRRERLFVLAPLSDLAPGLRPPGWHETVATRPAAPGSGRGQ